jgi:hypothetical protein
MQAIITVFKIELIDKSHVIDMINTLTLDLKEVGDAYIFSPKPGKLFELLNLLRDNHIVYGTHFNTANPDQ